MPPATTTKIFTQPAPETVVAPVFNYTDEQQAMMAELREASPPSKIRSAFD